MKTFEELLLKHTSPTLHHYQGALDAHKEYLAQFKPKAVEVEKLRNALEDAVNGLQWKIDNEDYDNSDVEKLEAWKLILQDNFLSQAKEVKELKTKLEYQEHYNDMLVKELDERDKPLPINHWIFHNELPLKSGWYETKNSAMEQNTFYHGGGGLQNVWWKDDQFVEKVLDFISYWRPIQNDKNKGTTNKTELKSVGRHLPPIIKSHSHELGKKEENDQHMLFHKCPECSWRCNCNDQPCSCCEMVDDICDYAWLQKGVIAFIQSQLLIPVEVEVISINDMMQDATIRTHSQGDIVVKYSRLFRTESECPCR